MLHEGIILNNTTNLMKSEMIRQIKRLKSTNPESWSRATFEAITMSSLDDVDWNFQDNKAGGLAGAFGGGAPDSPFGARAGERLSRWTLYLGIAFFVLILAMGIANKGRSSIRAIDDAAGVPVGAEPQAPAPVDVPVE